MNDDANMPDLAEHTDPGVPPPGKPLSMALQGLVLVVLGALLIALFFILPAIVGLAVATGDEADPAPSGAFQPSSQQWAGLHIQPVVRRESAPVVRADGRIALNDDFSAPVFSPYSGRVTRIFARAGDVVAAGAPLFAVISPELAQAENDMITALSAVRTARAQLGLAAANENRQHLLYLGHGAALKDYEQSRVDLSTAQGSLNSGQIAVSAVRNRLRALGLAALDIHALETASDLEHQSADTIVRAPIAGTITQRQINMGQNIVGAMASSGAATAVYTIGDLTRLWMVASAREDDAPFLHPGDLARVTVAAYPARIFDARITFVSPVIDPATHRLLVRADIANPDLALKPDMLAQFEIVAGPPAPVLTVPEAAIVYEGADAHVWVADAAHKALALRQIQIGRVAHGMAVIDAGLNLGDNVVTSGAVFIDRTLSGT